MKRLLFSTALATLLFSGCAVQSTKNDKAQECITLSEISEQDIDYDKYFTDGTFRFDFHHYGDCNSENYAFDGMKLEGQWAGSHKSLINPFGYGEQLFRIVDTE